MASTMRAIVKSVLSGDTLILRARPMNGQPPKERTLHLAGIVAPRIGNKDREDEPGAFLSRDFVRRMMVGKEVAFTICYATPSSSEYGIVQLVLAPDKFIDVAMEIVKAGWAKLRESSRAFPEAENGLDENQEKRRNQIVEAENSARQDQLGLWAEKIEPICTKYSMPEDPTAFLSEHKAKPLEAIVESVSNGTTIRARVILSPSQHQYITVTMAGVRSPRSKQYSSMSTPGNDGEPFGDEAKYFTECRLLQRNVMIFLISLPAPQATNLASQSQFEQPMTIGSFIGIVQHPAGSIAALLLTNGLARVVDWHASFLLSVPEAHGGGMERLRRAEKEGKEARQGIWKIASSPLDSALSPNGPTGSTPAGKRNLHGVVSRIWAGDTINVRVENTPSDIKIQLSSIRVPRLNDPKLGGLASDARELLRRRLIGKQVHVSIDYVRPKEGDFEEKECATVKLSTGVNIACLLLERGFATVLRHRQGDDRSLEYDQLMAAEMKGQTENKGMHSGKEFPPPKVTDASENANRANSHLSGWKRQGKMAAVVDYVAGGARLKIWLPKPEVKFTLVLGGIKCPKTARNHGERNDPFGLQALEFSMLNVMQRDVEVEVDAIDKSGGFIGSLHFNKTQNLAVLLVKEGLATCAEHSIDRFPYAKELQAAQEEAKQMRKNIWRDQDLEAPQPLDAKLNMKARAISPNVEFVDCILSDVREIVDGQLSFSIQILKNGGIPELAQLMTDFSLYHRSSNMTAPAVSYKTGDLVSAKFSVDNAWYRAKIRKNYAHKKEAEVVFIDYGNLQIVAYQDLKPLDSRFQALPPQAKEATMSFIKLLGPETDYGHEAMDCFRSLVEGQTMVANIDYREPGANGRLHVSLYETNALPTADSSINYKLVREGYAFIDHQVVYKEAYPEKLEALKAAKMEAKRNRLGAYEFGDAFED